MLAEAQEASEQCGREAGPAGRFAAGRQVGYDAGRQDGLPRAARKASL